MFINLQLHNIIITVPVVGHRVLQLARSVVYPTLKAKLLSYEINRRATTRAK